MSQDTIKKEVLNITPGKWESFIQPTYDGLATTINVKTKRIGTLEFVGIEETKANAKAICTGVNSTYGLGYRPEGMDELYKAASTVFSVLSEWNGFGNYTNLLEHLQTALNKAKL